MLKTTSKTLLLAAILMLPFSLQATETPSTEKVAPKTTVTAHAANSAAYTLLATMNMKESYEGNA